MLRLNWAWTFLLIGSATIAWLSCYKIDSPVIFWDACLKLLVYAILIWGCCSVLNKIYTTFARQCVQTLPIPGVPEERKDWLDERREQSRRCMQTDTNEMAESYKERILNPREKARKQKQDEELNLILGQTFRGTGQQLGSDRDIPEGIKKADNVNDDARERRRMPPNVILHRLKPPDLKLQKEKKVICLPEEPDAVCEDIIMITLYTPLDQRKSRRFHSSCRLQVLFDYMTTLGFSETRYTLSSSYPRKPLTEHREKTLNELRFEKRILLYVEEIDS